MDIKKTVDWIHMVQDRTQWQTAFEHDNERSVSIKSEEFLN
jgi:hypothetical protein